MTEDWNIIVIGGGAAGFFGAIICAERAPHKRVLILEKSRKVLTKVKISGGGRCNVTHDCFDPKAMATRHYPRGNKALIGPMFRFGVAETVRWFEGRGVELKTESDGRIFPTTDDSQTIINCLREAAREAGVVVRTSTGVKEVTPRGGRSENGDGFELLLDGGERLFADQVLLATGGTRLSRSEKLARGLGHKLQPAVPSLFTFHIDDGRINGLQGLTVENVEVSVEGQRLESSGPLLITHRGVSGPAILKISAWGARELHEMDYQFSIVVNWLPGIDVDRRIDDLRHGEGKKQVATRSFFEAIPKRLWRRLVKAAGISKKRRWADLSAESQRSLVGELTRCRLQVRGKSTNKDEFVTCGGVLTDEVDMRTMESRRCPGVFVAGELLDIDGVTGGFNFQNAWTTGYLAGCAMAEANA